MSLGVREVEAAAQGVTELVMKAHLHGAECGAGEPRAVHRLRAGCDVAG